jgi:hypothetical protein
MDADLISRVANFEVGRSEFAADDAARAEHLRARRRMRLARPTRWRPA